MTDYPVKPRTELSVRRLLAAEAEDAEGLVRRVGLGEYLAREDALRLGLLATPALRVQRAAEELTLRGVETFSVQQLLSESNASTIPLSQRAVYYAVSSLLDGAELVRVAWGRYALVRDPRGQVS